MSSDQSAGQARLKLATECLRVVNALAETIEGATDAIGRNALQELPGHVAKQELLCATLRGALSFAKPAGASLVLPSFADDPKLAEKIQAAFKKLHQLNLRYAALLKHSSQSMELLKLFYATYSDQFQPASRTQVKQQTWSCEA